MLGSIKSPLKRGRSWNETKVHAFYGLPIGIFGNAL
jgi:hypothetical protein